MSVLDAIGNTSIVRLRKVVPPECDIWVKLEWENPTGSVKDRMALAVIASAEADGRLKPGGTVVEYTGGSTGASLALVCAARGYRLRIVTSDAFSPEKLNQMTALGAELTLVPSENGLTTKKLILEMIETARAMSQDACARHREGAVKRAVVSPNRLRHRHRLVHHGCARRIERIRGEHPLRHEQEIAGSGILASGLGGHDTRRLATVE